MKRLFYLIKFRMICAAIIAIIPILSITLYSNAKERSRAIMEANDDIRVLTALVSSSIEGYIDELRQALNPVTQTQELQQIDAHSCQRSLANILKQSPQIEGAGFADINGTVFCAHPYSKQKIDALNKNTFKKVIKGGELVAGSYASVIYIAYPLRNKDTRLAGAAYIVLNLKSLVGLLINLNLPQCYSIILINDEGGVAARHPDNDKWVGMSVNYSQVQASMPIKGGIEFLEVRDLDDVRRYYGFSALSSKGAAIGLYTGVGVSYEDMYDNARSVFRFNLSGVVLTVVFTILIGWTGIYMYINGQISRLVAVVRRMAVGDLSVRSGFPYRESELGLLAATFDELASSLYKKREDTESALSRLRNSKERYSALVSNIPGAVYRRLADINWTMQFLGSAIDNTCGYPASTFLLNKGRPFASIIHPADIEGAVKKLDTALKGKQPYDLMYRIIHADGSIRWLNDKGAGVYNAEGSLLHLDGVIVDDTLRRQAEEVLLKLNRSLRTFGSCSQALVRATDESQLLTRICNTIVKEGGFPMVWVGYAEEKEGVKVVRPVACSGEERGYLVQIRVRWDDSDIGCGPVGNAIKTARPAVVEDIEVDDDFTPWRRAARQCGFRSLVCLPLIEGDAAFGALIVYSKETYAFDMEEIDLLVKLASELAYGIVTLRTRVQRWKAEEMIHRISNHHLAVLSAAGEGIVGLDSSGGITFANPAAAKMLGWQEDELIGMSISAIVQLSRFMQEAIHSRYGEVFRRKDGSVFAVEYVSTPIEEKGQTTGAVLVFKDITARRELEEKQKQHEQLLVQQSKLAAMGEMIGNIAHQWRQPLTVVSGTLLNIQDAYEYGELSEKYLSDKIKQANQSLEFMSVTIDDFRNFFKSDKEKTTFDIKDAVNKTVSIVSASLKDNFIDLRLDLQDELYVNGYPNEFSQVLLNVVTNAKDFLLERTVSEPFISINAFRHDTKAVLSVIDNAGGINEEIIDKVFDPYFTTKEQGKGTGIGLYMSKMIIEGHMGGLLTARNVRSDQYPFLSGAVGAEFCIILNAC
ncbi:MAG: PAS domain S-box protein [Nitrospirae bacterium]|nr:PAS domain S-box protein [Nitrospirota bacterium]